MLIFVGILLNSRTIGQHLIEYLVDVVAYLGSGVIRFYV
jgi:hypothetical protein